MNHDEVLRHKSNTEAVYELLLSRVNRWVDAHELAHAGGFCAWRSRVSDARAIALEHDQDVVWNRTNRASAYMLRPSRLGRDAAERINQKPLPLSGSAQ